VASDSEMVSRAVTLTGNAPLVDVMLPDSVRIVGHSEVSFRGSSRRILMGWRDSAPSL